MQKSLKAPKNKTKGGRKAIQNKPKGSSEDVLRDIKILMSLNTSSELPLGLFWIAFRPPFVLFLGAFKLFCIAKTPERVQKEHLRARTETEKKDIMND